MIQNGICNVETNNAECKYDGGDCCGYDCNGPNCQCYHQGNLFWGIDEKIFRQEGVSICLLIFSSHFKKEYFRSFLNLNELFLFEISLFL